MAQNILICNRCCGKNIVLDNNKHFIIENGIISESETKCSECGEYDFYAYGSFQSNLDISPSAPLSGNVPTTGCAERGR